MDTDLELKTGTGLDLALPIAGVGSRAYAFLIDWHIRILLCLLWIAGWLGLNWGVDVQDRLQTRGGALWALLLPTLFYALYHPVVELVMQGNSPGKRMAGIACVDTEGNPPSSGAILLRNVMRFIDSLPALYSVGVIAMLLTREQIRLGDMVAGTRVITVADNDGAALRSLERIRQARIEPKEAELVNELLDRWPTLTRESRRRYAQVLLKRFDMTPADRDAALKLQLERLLGV